MFEFLTIHPKSTQIPAKFELILIENFLKYSIFLQFIFLIFFLDLRTSFPDFRNNTLSLFRRFLLKLRLIYSNDLINYGKKKVEKENFVEFLNFLKNIYKFCLQELYPEAPFEVSFSLLEILKYIFIIFGPKNMNYKKNTILYS